MVVNSIDDAIALCENQVTLIGVLTELNIDIKNISHTDNVTVLYRGVVDCHNAFIKIYGRFTNNDMIFERAVQSLNNLTANIRTLSENGEITDTTYSKTASMVYVEGKFTSSHSINADYISSTTKTQEESALYGDIIGVPLEWTDDKQVKMLILTHHYHNILTFDCFEPHKELKGKTIYMESMYNPYDNGQYEPIVMATVNVMKEQIDQSVIDQALTEHDIFIASIGKNDG